MKTILTFKNSQDSERASARPVLCLIPGGPGLSSQTLSPLSILSRSFDLAFVDFGGTGKSQVSDGITFENTIKSVGFELQALNRSVVILGHSFGGIIAAHVAEKLGALVQGLCVIAAPLTSDSLSVVDQQYARNTTKAMSDAYQAWLDTPSNMNFSIWLSKYGRLFFRTEDDKRGETILLNDASSSHLFSQIREDLPADLTAAGLKTAAFKKLMIAGSEDLTLPLKTAQRDAETLNFIFKPVQDAAHFTFLDQPETVARLIEQHFCDERGET